MSDIMERTLAALPRLLGAGTGGQQRQSPPSRSFAALKNAVDNARGRSEQDAVVSHKISKDSFLPGHWLLWHISSHHSAGSQITSLISYVFVFCFF